ncbi:MAG TPA: metalloregulator ArsR/SmtB family transcription factor [Candidatus Saccharimonadales bacterium]|nr:metalloregulator ArsR/SmtB family transcription factor [Candidatus Saccharimonadales bacterium]
MLSPTEHKKLEQYIQGIDVSRITTAFDALGEPNRCLIFRALLKNNDINVGQLASVVGISKSLASQHLKVLLQASLVDKKKNGKNVYYHVNQQNSLVVALSKAVET